MAKRKVILDVDTGSDDAIALIAAMANPEFEVLGIMAVNGNRAVSITTENSLRISADGRHRSGLPGLCRTVDFLYAGLPPALPHVQCPGRGAL